MSETETKPTVECPDCDGSRYISMGQFVRGFKVCMNDVHFPELLDHLGPAPSNRCGNVTSGDHCRSQPAYHVLYATLTNIALCDKHFVEAKHKGEDEAWWNVHTYDRRACGVDGSMIDDEDPHSICIVQAPSVPVLPHTFG